MKNRNYMPMRAISLIFAMLFALTTVPPLPVWAAEGTASHLEESLAVNGATEVDETGESDLTEAKQSSGDSLDHILSAIQPGALNETREHTLRLEKVAATTNAFQSEAFITDVKEAANVLRQGMELRKENIHVKYAVSLDECDGSDASILASVEAVFEQALEHTGVPTQGDYLRWVYKSMTANISVSVADKYCLEIDYQPCYYTTAEQEVAVTTKLSEVMARFDFSQGATDYVKVKTIYDYICNHVVYDHANLNNDAYDLKYTAYAALVNGTSVCQGYAVLLYRMLLESGIDCRVIGGTSREEGHSWNIVKLGDSYYNVDSTWDSEYVQAGFAYRYFLKNDAKFPDHTRDTDYLAKEFVERYPISDLSYGDERGMWTDYAAGDFSGGNGTKENPFLIASPEELALVALNGATTAYYKLVCNIDLSAHEWEPISTFSGVFDGQGYTISNMHMSTVTRSCASGYGFFREIVDGTIQNVNFNNCVLAINDPTNHGLSADTFALVAGYSADSVIKNCNVNGVVTCSASSLCAGLIVGSAEGMLILNDVHANGSLQATAFDGGAQVGGLIGEIQNVDANITESSFDGTINAYANNIAEDADWVWAANFGGLIGGFYWGKCNIDNCFAFVEGDLIAIATLQCGGLVGWINIIDGDSFVVKNAYAVSVMKAKSSNVDDTFCGLFGEYQGIGSLFSDVDLSIGSVSSCMCFIENCAFFAHDKVYIYNNVVGTGQVRLWLDEYSLSEYAVSKLFGEILGYEADTWMIKDGCYPSLSNVNDYVIPKSFEHFYRDSICIVCDKVDTSVQAAGTWGSLSWHVAFGSLTISGNGMMEDGLYNEHTTQIEFPWSAYKFEKIIIEEGVECIAPFAFSEHKEIKEVILPSSLGAIYDYAFFHCYSLKTIELSKNTKLTPSALEKCVNLQLVKVDGENPYYVAVDGILLSKDGNDVVLVPAGYRGKVVIPYGVTTILTNSFRECRRVTYVELPESVRTIGYGAFSGCCFTEIQLPKSLERIGDFAFVGNWQLKKIELPSSVRTIGYGAFSDCHKLSRVILNEGLPLIEGSLFRHTGLVSIEIPDSVVSIGDEAFWGCTQLKEIVFKGEAPDISTSAFLEVDAIIYYPKCASSWTNDIKQNYGGSLVWVKSNSDHIYVPVVTPPTCTAEGYTTHTCSACKHSYVDTKVPATGHSMGAWSVTKPASCTDKGTEQRKCANCTHTETRDIAAKGHNYKHVVTPPTCTAQGYTTHTCSTCSHSYKDTYVNAKGHSMGAWSVTKPVSCTEKGNEQRKCANCTHTETRDIAVKDHSYKRVVTPPTCTAEGYTTHTCSVCSHSYVDTKVSATGHSMGAWSVTKPASCTDKGSEQRKCANCTHTETRDIAAKGHGYKSVVTKPTCTAEGYTTHTCSTCSHSYVDTYVTAKGHSMGSWSVTKPAFCTAKGSEQRKCANCTHTETRDIAAKGHSYKSVVTKPTCTAEGYTTHTCSACSYSYVDTYVPATGHSMGAWSVTKPATCTEKGSEQRKCANCSHTETRDIAAKGHNYKHAVTPPTCTAEGYTTHTCSTCGHSYKDTPVSATGHSMGAWSVTKPASCTDKGTEQRKCANCSHTETRDIAAKGHSYKHVVTPPTCTAEGYTTHTCSTCSHSCKDTFVSAKGHIYSGEHDRTCDTCGATREVDEEVLRMYGSNRFDTAFGAANLLKETLGVDKFDNVIVACGTNFADALAGSYLGKVKNAPILLVQPNMVPTVRAYIVENLKPGGTVYLLGGETIVPGGVSEGLTQFVTKRLWGANRYETNLAILEEAGVTGGEILVCTGYGFADSLSASAVGKPILLVDKRLDAKQQAFLAGLKNDRYIIVGGVGAVNEVVEDSLKGYGAIERLAGANRFTTSVMVAERFFDSPTTAVVAYAANFPDGLCGGPLAAAMGGPLLLTANNDAHITAAYTEANGIRDGVVLGGPGLISDAAVRKVFAMATDAPILVN